MQVEIEVQVPIAVSIGPTHVVCRQVFVIYYRLGDDGASR